MKDKKEKVPQNCIQYEFHKQPLTFLAEYFNTSLTHGLNEIEAKQLLIKNGKNILCQPKKNAFMKLISYLFTGFCGLLWVAAIVFCLAWKPIGNPPDPTNLGMSILLIVVIFLQVTRDFFNKLVDPVFSTRQVKVEKIYTQKKPVPYFNEKKLFLVHLT